MHLHLGSVGNAVSTFAQQSFGFFPFAPQSHGAEIVNALALFLLLLLDLFLIGRQERLKRREVERRLQTIIDKINGEISLLHFLFVLSGIASSFLRCFSRAEDFCYLCLVLSHLAPFRWGMLSHDILPCAANLHIVRQMAIMSLHWNNSDPEPPMKISSFQQMVREESFMDNPFPTGDREMGTLLTRARALRSLCLAKGQSSPFSLGTSGTCSQTLTSLGLT